MEIKIGTQQILNILYVIAWIIFIGVCIEAGGIIFNAILTLVLNPDAAKHLWKQVDLSNLIQYDRGHFFAVSFFMSVVAVLKCCMFYLIIKILHDKKLNMSQPFSLELKNFIAALCYLSVGIGLFSSGGINYSEWLISHGVSMPSAENMRLGGADVWLFMGVVLFVIVQIFKRGIEIQTENELTV